MTAETPAGSETPRTDNTYSLVRGREVYAIPQGHLEKNTPSRWSYEAILDLIDFARTLERLLRELRANFDTPEQNSHLPELSNLLSRIDNFLDEKS